MTKDDLYARIEDYLAGQMSPAEKSEIERMISADLELMDYVQFSRQLDAQMLNQVWHKPTPGFTVRAMARAGLIQSHPIPVWFLTWQKMRAWLPVAVVMVFVAANLNSVLTWGRALLLVVGGWLSRITGIPELAANPIVGVAVIFSVVALAMATCVVSGRCRITN